MYQRDYLLRMIEQFSVVLGKVIFQRRNQRFAEAMELLAQAMKQLLGLNSKLVRALSAKDLLGLLSTQGHVDAGKVLLLGDMLKAEGEVLYDQGKEADSLDCRLKALELLLELNRIPEAEPFKPDAAERIAELLPQVSQLRMTPHVTVLLMHYYSESGQLARAEDMLFFALEDEPDNAGLLDEGLRMVESWSGLEAAEREAGGLTEEEIGDMHEQLLKLKQKAGQSENISREFD
ncbi:DUF6483 family protein [Paenibacillus piri]|uniref:Tetratricopeptide repeat protein n=1 Tax=Paenibacillus piri TaxID=2547395 RepID=A0A4R5KL07_9BACL|nr:DUF6483 family protein [Paenibacillus piri]TDF95545.1 hypothetical protein E1757_20865 [Paenibacillus piri]